MATTYEKIATTTLSSAAASIDFTSIPNTYTDLRVVLVGTAATASYPWMRFNGDTASNYSDTYMYGNGSGVVAARNTNITAWYMGAWTLSTVYPSLFTMDIFSYAGSTYKTGLSTGSTEYGGSGFTDVIASLWRSTSAITSIKLFLDAGYNLNAGSTATLYGIKAA
jgi:hypothetical protein